MIKRLLVQVALATAWLQAIPCTAQNLVPNPSFEQYNNCPNGISSLSYDPSFNTFPTVKGWGNALQQGSADYFNTCAAFSTYASVPWNSFGYQIPHNGNGYVGIIAWQGSGQPGQMTSDFAEYIQCKLTQPMVAGTKYCVNFYVHNAVSVAQYNFVGIDKIGVNFSATKTSSPSAFTLSLNNSVSSASGNHLTDSTDWMKVNAIYTATGGEEWLTLGWFDNGTAPSIRPVSPTTPNSSYKYRCYLYIDDVSVTPVNGPDTVYTTHDSLYCQNLTTGMALKSKAEFGEYSWSNGTLKDTISITDTGTYWCVGTAGCVTYVDSFIVRYDSTPKLSLAKEVINCKNEPVTLRSNFIADNYTWSTGAVTDSIIVQQSGTYTLAVGGKCGVQKDSVKVYIQLPTAPPLAVDTTVCQYALRPKISLKDTAITWYVLAEGIIGTKQQPTIVTIEPGIYHLFITTTSGKCESEKVPLDVNIQYTPHEELGDKEVMCENNLEVIGENNADVTYKWNTGANTCCVLPEREGLYKRAANNECGSFIDSIWIYHNVCEECIVFPNAFIPLKDNSNNIFRPLIKCPVSDFQIKIYNRWGNLVYTSDDVYKGWNGRYNYDWAPVGTYVYIVEYTAQGKRQKQHITGNVTLLR